MKFRCAYFSFLIIIAFSIKCYGNKNNQCNRKIELRILTMNVLNSMQHGGWNEANWNDSGCSRGEQVVKVMLECNANIICVQEYLHNDSWLKEELEEKTGEQWYIRILPRNCAILSRFPIQLHGNIIRTPINIDNDFVIDVFSTHMFVYSYLPYSMTSIDNRDEAKQKVIKNNYNFYWSTIVGELKDAHRYTGNCILTGDFNEPSHLDYTDDAVKKGIVPCDFSGLMSSFLVDSLGMKDSWHQYRELIGGSEVTKRGITWSPTTWNYKKRWDDDRIDFIYYKFNDAKIVLKEALLIGETPTQRIKGDKVDVQINPWPSDHRAVLTVFEVVD